MTPWSVQFEQKNNSEINNIWTNYFEVKNLNVKMKKKLATRAICAGHLASLLQTKLPKHSGT